MGAKNISVSTGPLLLWKITPLLNQDKHKKDKYATSGSVLRPVSRTESHECHVPKSSYSFSMLRQKDLCKGRSAVSEPFKSANAGKHKTPFLPSLKTYYAPAKPNALLHSFTVAQPCPNFYFSAQSSSKTKYSWVWFHTHNENECVSIHVSEPEFLSTPPFMSPFEGCMYREATLTTSQAKPLHCSHGKSQAGVGKNLQPELVALVHPRVCPWMERPLGCLRRVQHKAISNFPTLSFGWVGLSLGKTNTLQVDHVHI